MRLEFCGSYVFCCFLSKVSSETCSWNTTPKCAVVTIMIEKFRNGENTFLSVCLELCGINVFFNSELGNLQLEHNAEVCFGFKIINNYYDFKNIGKGETLFCLCV